MLPWENFGTNEEEEEEKEKAAGEGEEEEDDEKNTISTCFVQVNYDIKVSLPPKKRTIKLGDTRPLRCKKFVSKYEIPVADNPLAGLRWDDLRLGKSQHVVKGKLFIFVTIFITDISDQVSVTHKKKY